MIIRARAPLRLGLAGGGTDVSPYCDLHGGYVLNATIDRYAYANIKKLNKPEVIFSATDLQKTEHIENPILPIPLTGSLDLHKAIYNHIMLEYNSGVFIPIELSTFCDAPAGSGLGSSSTLVVAMVKAFAELLNLPFDDYTIARLAFKIERIDCQLQGGRQDQYSATFGGFNFMEFKAEENVIVNPLRIRNSVICELEASILLYYTGVSRESARIIADQASNMTSGSQKTFDAMHGIKREAVLMKESLLKADFNGMISSLREGWESKKRSAKTVSNPLIDNIFEAALSAGALAGKISGAGGGGFMMLFVTPENRMNVVRTLQQFEGSISNCHFTKQGAQSWKIQ